MWKIINIIIIGILLYVALLSSTTEAKFNFAKFREMFFVKKLMMKVKPLGLVGQPPLKFNVVNKELKISPKPGSLINPTTNGPNQAEITKGSGMGLKGDSGELKVMLPVEKPVYNYCGMVITSLMTLGGGPVMQMAIYWKKPNKQWTLVANPRTGEEYFIPRMRPGSMTRIILFDSIPATEFGIKLRGLRGRNLNIRMALLKGCHYRNRLTVKNCGEKVDGNIRFKDLPYGVPIHVKCPLDCIRTWPCWGWQFYSIDSPICWTATQYFGRSGSGVITMYKIPMSHFFDQTADSRVNHGIYCRRSIVHYPAIAFERIMYERVKRVYRDYMGA